MVDLGVSEKPFKLSRSKIDLHTSAGLSTLLSGANQKYEDESRKPSYRKLVLMQELKAAWFALPSDAATGKATEHFLSAFRELKPNPVRLQMHLTDVRCSK